MVAEFDEDQAADVGDKEGDHRGNDGEDGHEGEWLEEGLRVVEGRVEVVFPEKLAVEEPENLKVKTAA